MGAKNHAIVLPDANVDATLNSLVAAGFGAAGQRCMALSTAVFVGGSEPWYCSLFLVVFLYFIVAFNCVMCA
jgi:Aldehyde dehydrogenase family